MVCGFAPVTVSVTVMPETGDPPPLVTVVTNDAAVPVRDGPGVAEVNVKVRVFESEIVAVASAPSFWPVAVSVTFCVPEMLAGAV